MFRVQLIACFLFASLSAFGADPVSSVEGRVIDGRGQPMPQVTVMIVQPERIKGYDEFRTTTGPDGTFRIEALYPKSPYILGLGHEDQQNKDVQWEYVPSKQPFFTAAPEGETRILGDITARFMRFGNGLVIDTTTNLQWCVGPAQLDGATAVMGAMRITPDQAKKWIASLPTDGGPPWTMPSPEQVQAIMLEQGNEREAFGGMIELGGTWGFLTTGKKVASRLTRLGKGGEWMADWLTGKGERAIAVRAAPGKDAVPAAKTDTQEPATTSPTDTVSRSDDQRTRLQLEFQMTTTPNDFWYATDEVVVLVMPKKSSGTLTRADHIQALRDALAKAGGK